MHGRKPKVAQRWEQEPRLVRVHVPASLRGHQKPRVGRRSDRKRGAGLPPFEALRWAAPSALEREPGL